MYTQFINTDRPQECACVLARRINPHPSVHHQIRRALQSRDIAAPHSPTLTTSVSQMANCALRLFCRFFVATRSSQHRNFSIFVYVRFLFVCVCTPVYMPHRVLAVRVGVVKRDVAGAHSETC